MIDIRTEQMFPLKDAIRYVPGRPDKSTLYRWVFGGKLESVKVGGRLFTSREAIDRFVARCTSPADVPRSVSHDARQAETELTELCI